MDRYEGKKINKPVIKSLGETYCSILKAHQKRKERFLNWESGVIPEEYWAKFQISAKKSHWFIAKVGTERRHECGFW